MTFNINYLLKSHWAKWFWIGLNLTGFGVTVNDLIDWFNFLSIDFCPDCRRRYQVHYRHEKYSSRHKRSRTTTGSHRSIVTGNIQWKYDNINRVDFEGKKAASIFNNLSSNWKSVANCWPYSSYSLNIFEIYIWNISYLL